MHHAHVSITDMEIDAKKGSIEMSVRIYTVDLERVLHDKYNIHGWMGTASEHPDSRRLLVEYLNERFSIVVNNGEKISLVTDSINIAEDMLWFYVRGAARQEIKHVEINNRLMTDFFSTQRNMMIIGTGRNEEDKTFMLGRNNFKVEFTL